MCWIVIERGLFPVIFYMGWIIYTHTHTHTHTSIFPRLLYDYTRMVAVKIFVDDLLVQDLLDLLKFICQILTYLGQAFDRFFAPAIALKHNILHLDL